MFIERLKLRNVCQFQDADIAFGPGMNGILGRNGHGKSNMINMLYAGLTGDFSVNAGNKDLNIYGPVRDDKKIPADIDVTFSVHGSRIFVHRNVRGSRSYLTINGGEPLYGDTVVTDKVCELLEADSVLLADHVFVRQGEIYRGVFGGRESERLKALQQLFQLDLATTCYDALTRALTSLPEPTAAADVQVLDARIVTLEADLEQVAKDLAAMPTMDALATDVAADNAILENCRQADALHDQLAAQLELCSVAETKLSVATSKLEATTVPQSTADLDSKIAVLRSTLLEWDRYDERTEAIQAYADTAAQLAIAKAAPQVTEETRSTELRAELDELSTVAENAILRHFDQGQTTCPTCKRTVDDTFAALLEDLRKSVSEKELRQAALRKRIEARRLYDNAVIAWTAGEQLRQKNLEKHLATPAPAALPQPDGDPDTLYDEMTTLDSMRSHLVAKNAEYAVLQKAQADARANFDRVDAVRADIAKRLAAMPTYTEQDISAAMARVAQYTSSVTRHGELTGQQATLRSQLRDAHASKATLADSITRNKVRDAQHARLSALRDCVHPQALPRLYTQRYMYELAQDVNKLLELFQVSFTVGIDDGLNMYVTHVDGTMDSVQRLSGGQKVVLALGFRVAVYRRFARHVGVLVLDEPTEYLDKENVNCLLLALDRVRQLADSESMQCIVITHESRLQGIFDNVVTLTGPGKV